jgi:hypothetical protein
MRTLNMRCRFSLHRAMRRIATLTVGVLACANAHGFESAGLESFDSVLQLQADDLFGVHAEPAVGVLASAAVELEAQRSDELDAILAVAENRGSISVAAPNTADINFDRRSFRPRHGGFDRSRGDGDKHPDCGGGWYCGGLGEGNGDGGGLGTQPVPEPSAPGLMLAGALLAGLLVWLRRGSARSFAVAQ